MSDGLSAILETTTAERLTTGVQQQFGHSSRRHLRACPAGAREAAVEGLDRYVGG